MTIFGFDISTWQDSPLVAGHVDFRKMRDYGASFVVIRAGQGNWKDPDFQISWANAKGVLPRNSYYYFDNDYDPKIQSENYCSIINGDHEGYCWLDLEDPNPGVFKNWRFWYDFLVHFRSLCNYPIGIYTNYWYFIEMTQFATASEKAWFKQFPLWLASYPPNPFIVDHSLIKIPPPWMKYVMLQSGTPAIGSAAGVESEDIDYNIWMEEDQFSIFFPPTGEPEPMSDYIELKSTVSTEYRSIRDQVSYPNPPHIFGATSISKRIQPGNTAKANPTDFYRYAQDVLISGEVHARAGDIWWKVYEANGTAISGWSAEIHKGIRYLNTRLVTEVLPPSEEYIIHVKDGVQRKFIPDE